MKKGERIIMNYDIWKKKKTEAKEKVLPWDYPIEVPKEVLRQNLTEVTIFFDYEDNQVKAQWKKETPTGKEEGIVPYWKNIPSQTNSSIMLEYEFNPENCTYIPVTRNLEPSMEEEPVGIYGLRWLEMMERDYEVELELLQAAHLRLSVAREVEKMARTYQEILEKQFEENNPRPTGSYEAIVQWERTKQFEVDSQVMREIVLHPYTAAILTR